MRYFKSFQEKVYVSPEFLEAREEAKRMKNSKRGIPRILFFRAFIDDEKPACFSIYFEPEELEVVQDTIDDFKEILGKNVKLIDLEHGFKNEELFLELEKINLENFKNKLRLIVKIEEKNREDFEYCYLLFIEYDLKNSKYLF